ncbi:uncharacterized protein LOC124150289 [Haliotis rufescens]|uniref:uncharacterized protein LOC124150289 n=1 Tax=Haliotis rufescens TaxID=6454 RepID=UPI00201F8474|nr:uncharacterized protein LOC124150289 [Haliotis rufescens]XP_046378219.2 uncharacterized protein LOC124150289 [Haliotis rufescens]
MRNLILFPLLLHLTTAVIDSTVCSTPGTQANNIPRPTVPSTFEVHVECIIVNKNRSTEVHEYFQESAKYAAVHQTLLGGHFYGYFDYSDNEFLGIDPDAKTCQVSDLSTSGQRFLFGVNVTGGGNRIYSAAGALHFGSGSVEVYSGTDTVRGINVQKWYSCQYWAGMDATMNVTWYFSDPHEWDMALNIPSIPVRAWVKGTRGASADGPAHPFEHIYDLIHFKNYIEKSDAFETPSLVSCPGRKLTKPFPAISTAFSFTAEIIDTVRADVRFMQEYYDDQMKLVKYVYTPAVSSSNGQFGYQPLTEIHDFNTGMAYITDNQRGNCTWQLIEQNNFDDVDSDPFNVRIKTAKQFFHMDASGVTYEGIKLSRGIRTDTYVGRRTDFPAANPLNSTFEWHFLTSDYQTMQQKTAMYTGGVPVQLRLSMPSYDIDYTYNIYNYVQSKANLLNWDISACYGNLDRRKFDFTVPGTYANHIDDNRELFRYSILLSLMSYLAVSPLRIAHLRLVFQTDVHIRFELLDIAPMIGNVKTNVTETPLKLAASLLVDAINTNKFVIPLDYDKLSDVSSVVATPNSIREYTYEDELAPPVEEYTPGAMGGLAIGMIILGGGGGAGLSYLFFK